MKKRLSIHDIAKALQVSATTISFVLNGKAAEKRIGKELQKKIEDYTQQIGYKPNLVAQSLRTGKTRIIGMLVEDISDPFFSGIARIIEAKAYQAGYKLFFLSTENDTEKTRALIHVFRERQVDGYIIAPPPGIEEEIQLLLNDDHPVILFDRYFPAIKTNTVIVDNFNGAFDAIEHLQNNGYATIGLVTLESEQTQMADRLKGYLKAVHEKVQQPFVLKIPYPASHEEMQEKIRLFFTQYPDLDAVLFATNYLTLCGLEVISSLGLRIPDDIAIVSFDNNTHFRLFAPSVTAIDQPLQQLSEEVIRMLIDCINDPVKNRETETIVLPARLIIRNSSASKPRRKLKKAIR